MTKNSKKNKILICDDEPELVELVQLQLEVVGYDVVTANDGEEALQKAYSENPDLVLLDIRMPKIDGREVCHRLHLDSRTKDIPVIFLSAKVRGEEKKDVPREEADYLVKPFDMKDLLLKIATILQGRFPRHVASRRS